MASTLLNYSAVAQSSSSAILYDSAGSGDRTAGRSNDWSMSVSANYSAVAAGKVSFDGAKGNSGAQSANANITAVIPVNDKWFVPMGIGSRHDFLGNPGGAPIPDQIDTLGFNAGVGYHFNEQWTLIGSLGPRLYRLDDLTSSDIGVGGMIRATYRWKPNLTIALGIAFDPDRDVPVLPAAGMRWGIQTNLTLSLMFPKSGLDYRVAPRLNLFAGGDGNFTVFCAEKDLGDKIGLPQFNNGLGTYRDFRIGVGAEYRIVRGLSAAVEGGESFGREIDYARIGETVKFGSAPYIQAGLKCRF